MREFDENQALRTRYAPTLPTPGSSRLPVHQLEPAPYPRTHKDGATFQEHADAWHPEKMAFPSQGDCRAGCIAAVAGGKAPLHRYCSRILEPHVVPVSETQSPSACLRQECPQGITDVVSGGILGDKGVTYCFQENQP